MHILEVARQQTLCPSLSLSVAAAALPNALPLFFLLRLDSFSQEDDELGLRFLFLAKLVVIRKRRRTQ
jgi:hypothetical protein